MRTYKWLLVLVSILLFLGLVTYHGYRWASNYAERYLLTKVPELIEKVGGKDVSLREVDVNLGEAHLKGIKASAERTICSLSVDGVEIGYSPFRLLKSGFNPTQSTKKISITNPRLTIKLPKDFSPSKDTLPPIFSWLPRGGLSISGGQITFVNADHQTIATIRKIEGHIDHRDGQRAKIGLSGELTNSEGVNTPDFPRGFRASPKPFASTFHGLELKGGKVKLSADLRRGAEGSVEHSGRIVIEDGVVNVVPFETEIKDIHIVAESDGKSLFFKKAKAEFEGGNLKLSGKIAEPARPELFLKLEAEGADLAKFARLLGLDKSMAPKGTTKVVAEIKGPLKAPIVSAEIVSDRITVAGLMIADMKAKMELKDKTLCLNRVSGKMGGGSLDGSGWVDFTHRKPALDLSFKLKRGDLESLTHLLGIEGIRARGDVVFDVRGRRGRVISEGYCLLNRFEYKGIKLSQVEGKYRYQDGAFQFSIEKGKTCLRGTVSRTSTNPKVSAELRMVDIPMEALLSLASPRLAGTDIGAKLSLTVNFDGSWPKLKVRGGGSVEKGPLVKGNFELEGMAHKRWKDGYKLEVTVWTEPLMIKDLPYSIQAELCLDESRLEVKNFSVNDYLLAKGTVGLKGAKKITGQVRFVNADVARLANVILPNGAEVAGRLWGTILLAGSIDHPQIHGRVHVNDGAYNGVDPLRATTDFTIDGKKASVNSFKLCAHGAPLTEIAGTAELGGDLRLQAWGEKVNAAHLIKLITGRTDLAAGQLTYRFSLLGDMGSPRLEGNLSAANGKLVNIEFDELQSEVTVDKGSVEIEGLSLEKMGAYKVAVKGKIPHELYRSSGEAKMAEEIDLTIHAEDDIMAIIPYLTDRITRATGRGKADIRFGGTARSLTLVEAEIAFFKGEIEPNVLTREITDLHGEIRKSADSKFLHIKEIEGKIEGKRLRIYNREQVKFADRENVPLMVDRLGINLGTLIVETEPGGVRINIPGLMFEGEEGRIELTGRAKGEPFSISGPSQNPLVRGIVKLYDFDFTYPIAKGKREGDGLDPLKAIDWDVGLIVKRDVWYRGDLAHLQIEENSRLDFHGSVSRGDFLVLGKVRSTRGVLVYLNTEFEVEEIGLEFDPYDPYPLLYGRAKTTVPATETERKTDIYLNLYAIDPETGERVYRARWDEVKFELRAEDPELDTQEKVLARMGYGEQYLDKVVELIGGGVDIYLWKSMLRPVENRLKEALGLDVVRLRPSITRNLLLGRGTVDIYDDPYSNIALLRGSKFTLGQYLSDDWFLSYTGQLQTRGDGHGENLSIKHQLALELNIKPNTRLMLEYDYDRLLKKRDKKIKFERYFLF